MEYTKEELLQLIEEGFRTLYIRVGTDGCASVALARAIADRTLQPLSVSDARELMAHHGISENYVPPRVLARHALAVYFSFEEALARLEGSTLLPGFQKAIQEGVVRSVEDAYLLSDEAIDRIIDR